MSCLRVCTTSAPAGLQNRRISLDVENVRLQQTNPKRKHPRSVLTAKIMQERAWSYAALAKKSREESVGKRIAITELVDQKAIDIVAYTCPRLNQVLISKSALIATVMHQEVRNCVHDVNRDTRPLQLTVLKAESNVGFAKKHCSQDQ